MTAQLNSENLKLVNSEVPIPAYNRKKVKAGIVHFGVGAFHRAHQAITIDALMNLGLDDDFGICGIGFLPSDKKMNEVFEEQNSLYTLTLKHPDGRHEPRVIGSIIDYVFAPEEPHRVIEVLSNPDIRIVSMTITEGGYNFDRVTGEFDFTNPWVLADLVSGSIPSTTFGFLTAGLKLRRERGIAPFTVMSCDNIQGNGEVAKKMFVAFAKAKDPELGDWIEASVAFPNSMVDRITPVTSETDIADATTALGLVDKWPVVAEPFFQWVIEDHFPLGRPHFESAGVQMVEDVMPYELMKLRLLNASHQGLCYFGYLSGYRFAHDAVNDPAIAKFLLKYMDEEATPTLLPVPGIDLDAYKAMLITRFSNPEVKDTIARLCAESSDRIPKWLVPVIQSQLESGGKVEMSAAIVASWARYAEGVDEQGEPINVVDPLCDELILIAKSQLENPLAFIQNRKLFGNLAENERFTTAYLTTLKSLHEVGAHAAVIQLSNQ